LHRRGRGEPNKRKRQGGRPEGVNGRETSKRGKNFSRTKKDPLGGGARDVRGGGLNVVWKGVFGRNPGKGKKRKKKKGRTIHGAGRKPEREDRQKKFCHNESSKNKGGRGGE